MLEKVDLGHCRLESTRFLPQVLHPLVAAAERSEPLEPVVSAIIQVLGFDSFMYGVSLSSGRPGAEQKSHVFTTLPREWVTRYDQRAYIEVDPRVLYSLDSAMPFLWDQLSERGKDAATDEFLEDAAEFGVSSGVALAIFPASQGHVVVAFNSARPEINELRRFEIARSLGDLFLLSVYFHELFMKTVIARGVPPRSQGTPLSPQEKRCLMYAAHGFTSRNIASELAISERMVELHFSHLRSKLGVANRQEAIAKAVAEGMIQRGQLPGMDENDHRVEERRRAYGIG